MDSIAFKLLRDIAIPVIFIAGLATLPIANYKLGGDIWMPPAAVLLLLRVGAVGASGFVASFRTGLGLGWAAVAGAFVVFVEQIFVVALFFLIDGQVNSAQSVAQLFLVIVWIAAGVGAAGGLAGISLRNRRSRVA
jgi:hypothetical protein